MNDSDDDSYELELLAAVKYLAVVFFGDVLHDKGVFGGFSTTECIVCYLKPFKTP